MAKGICADCGGFDVEWMRYCSTHNVEYCRGCDCPWCSEEASMSDEEIDDDGVSTETTGRER